MFGTLWLLYRQMYLYSFIAIGISFSIGVVEEMLGILGTGFSIGMAVAFGLVGNNLYKFFVEKKIQKIKNAAGSHRNIDQELQQQGGTNIAAPIALFILVLVTVVLSIYA